MALQKQQIPIVFQGGIDSKHDKKTVIPTRVALLNNAVFDDANTVVLRAGLEVVPTTTIGLGAAIGTPYRMFPHLNRAVVESSAGAHRLHGNTSSHLIPKRTLGDQTQDQMFYRASKVEKAVSGAIPSVPSSVTLPVRSNNFDCATGDGVSVWAWEERDLAIGRMGIRVSVRLEADNSEIYNYVINDTVTTAIYVNPRVIYFGQRFFIYYGKWFSAVPATYYVARSMVEVASNYASAQPEQIVFTSGAGGATDRVIFDVDSDSTYIGLCVRDNNGPPGNLVMIGLNTADGYTNSRTSTKAPGAQVETITCLMTTNATNEHHLQVLYSRANNNVYAIQVRLSGALASLGETLVSVGDVATRIGRIVAVDNAPGTANFVIAYDNSTTATYATPPTASSRLRVAKLTKALVNVGTVQFFDGWLIHGRFFSLKNRYWLPMFFPHGVTPSVFVVGLESNVLDATLGPCRPLCLARVAYGECGYIRSQWIQHMRVPASFVIGSKATLPFNRWVADLQLAGGVNTTPSTIQRCDIETTVAPGVDGQLGHTESNGLTLLAGACPHLYDGVEVVEAGFHHDPYIYSMTVVAGVDFPIGTFSVCYTQQWQDARGNTHEGPPSNIKQVTTTAANQSLTSDVAFAPTQKYGVQTVFWRTAVGAGAAGPFYRALSETGVALSDAQLITGDPLYSTGAAGDILPNDPVPAHRDSCSWQDRTWLIGCDDGYEVRFSKTKVNSFAPSFPTGFTRRIPEGFGRGVAVRPLGNKLVVICENRIGVIYGSGPLANGEADNYSQIEAMIESTGGDFNSPLAAIVSREGCWFKSSQGIRLITPSGALAQGRDGLEVGAELDNGFSAVNSMKTLVLQAISNASSGKEQVRFYEVADRNSSFNGLVFVWDSQWQQWSTFDGHDCGGGAVYAADSFLHMNQGGPTLFRPNDSLAEDAGAAFYGLLLTAPISLAGLEGFQRAYRIQLLAEVKEHDNSVSQLQLGVGFDYGSISENTATVAVAGTPIVLEHHLAHQKCSAVQFRVIWNADTGEVGHLRLTGMTLQVGLKQGLNKVPSTKRF